MNLQLFNTLSGRKEKFEPLHHPEVRMYTCGPTVYDFAHIGNFRTYVFQDLLKRYLIYKNFKVKHVMNITDVDDKTIAGAQKKNVSLKEFTNEYTNAFHDDLKTLGIIPPTVEILATDTIPKMIQVITRLLENGNAYVKDGSVYFRVSSFSKYGKLSKKDLEKNIVGARVDQDEYEKEEGADFALWKKAKEGEPFWESPWGKGRPGWHIECSTMSLDSFGWETLDIHTGGEDLIFPHHENEIAQSECATGKKFVNYWLHAKHLLVNGEKMSKSKGNFFTLRDLISKGYHPMAIRYLLIATHYRKPLNFTLEGIEAAKQSLLRIRTFWENTSALPFGVTPSGNCDQLLEEACRDVSKAMDDDLNVSEAFGVIFELMRKVNQLVSDGKLHMPDTAHIHVFMSDMDGIFGVFSDRALVMLEDERIPDDVLQLADQRQKARQAGKFLDADSIRRQISDKGWCIEDTSDGGYKLKKTL